MKYVEHDSLPIPLHGNSNSVQKQTGNGNNDAAKKLAHMARWHETPKGREWASNLQLKDLVSGKPTNLRVAINQAGKQAVEAFLTSQVQQLNESFKGIDADKRLTIEDCREVAVFCINDFGGVLQAKDIILFIRAFKSGQISTDGGQKFQMPTIYGRLTQREISEGLQVYCKAKQAAHREYVDELAKIADHYETQVSQINEAQRESLKAWAEQNNQYALLSKIRLYERYVSGELEKEREECKSLPPIDPPKGEFAGTRLLKNIYPDGKLPKKSDV